MVGYVKVPKYMQNELEKASSYIIEAHKKIEKFEEWVKNNTNEHFDMAVLRGCANDVSGLTWDDQEHQTEALTEIEYGNEVNIDELEKAINYFKDKF